MFWYAISKVATFHGLELLTSNKWTEGKIQQAENLFKIDKDYLEIAEVLGRTPKAIGAKAEELRYQKRLIKSKNNGADKEVLEVLTICNGGLVGFFAKKFNI